MPRKHTVPKKLNNKYATGHIVPYVVCCNMSSWLKVKMKYADLNRFKALDNGKSLTVRNVMLLCTDVVETPAYFLNMFFHHYNGLLFSYGFHYYWTWFFGPLLILLMTSYQSQSNPSPQKRTLSLMYCLFTLRSYRSHGILSYCNIQDDELTVQ